MKNSLFAALLLVMSGAALAGTEHYLRRDGNHVQHLKITRAGNDISASMDVDFEPSGEAEAGRKACSAAISGDAKQTGDNLITFRKQIPEETDHCALTITLSNDGAKVEQSPECGYFVGGICHFDSEGKELVRIK
jgi:hypothetical protein